MGSQTAGADSRRAGRRQPARPAGCWAKTARGIQPARKPASGGDASEVRAGPTARGGRAIARRQTGLPAHGGNRACRRAEASGPAGARGGDLASERAGSRQERPDPARHSAAPGSQRGAGRGRAWGRGRSGCSLRLARGAGTGPACSKSASDQPAGEARGRAEPDQATAVADMERRRLRTARSGATRANGAGPSARA